MAISIENVPSYFKGLRIPDEDPTFDIFKTSAAPAPIAAKTPVMKTSTAPAAHGKIPARHWYSHLRMGIRALLNAQMVDYRLLEESYAARIMALDHCSRDDTIDLLRALQWRWYEHAHHMNNMAQIEREVDTLCEKDLVEIFQYAMLSVEQTQDYNRLVRGKSALTADEAMKRLVGEDAFFRSRDIARIVLEGKTNPTALNAVWVNPQVQRRDETPEQRQQREKEMNEALARKRIGDHNDQLIRLAAEERAQKAIAEAEQTRRQLEELERQRVQAERDAAELEALLLLEERKDNESMGSW